MPFYDYTCSNCAKRIEVMHGVNDFGPGACERCGGPMRKMLSSPTFVFKGSGWAKKERSAASSGAGDAKQDGGSADSSAGESAPKGEQKKRDAGAAKSTADSSPDGGSAKGNGTGDAA